MADRESGQPSVHYRVSLDRVRGAETRQYLFMMRRFRYAGRIQIRQESDGQLDRSRLQGPESTRRQAQKSPEREGMRNENRPGFDLPVDPSPRPLVLRQFGPERIQEEIGIGKNHVWEDPYGGSFSAILSMYVVSSSRVSAFKSKPGFRRIPES